MQFILVTHAVIRSCSQGLESLLKMGQRGKWTWCSQHLCSLATQNLSCLTKIKLPGSTTGGKSRLSPRAPTFHPAFPSEFRQSVVLLHWQAFYPETNNPKVVTKLLPTWGLIWTPISNLNSCTWLAIQACDYFKCIPFKTTLKWPMRLPMVLGDCLFWASLLRPKNPQYMEGTHETQTLSTFFFYNDCNYQNE